MFEKIFDTEGKRFWLLVSIIVVLGTAVAIFIMTRPVENNEEVKSDVSLTATEKEAISKNVKTLIETSTKWGLRSEAVTPENILSVKDVVASNGATADTHWISRNEVYLGLKDQYLMPFGPLWYEGGKVASWFDPYSREALARFVPIDVNVNVPENGSTLNISGESLPAATVDVAFSVSETRLVQTVDDSSWDGTFNVEEKVFNDSAQVIVVFYEDEWKIYDVRGSQFPFLQVTWSTPDQSYENFQFDFTKTGEIKAVLEGN